MADDVDPLDATLDRAFDKAFEGRTDPVEAVETVEPETTEEAPSVDRARGPDGKFIAKDAAEPEQPVEAVPAVEAPVAAPEEPLAPVAAVEAPARFTAEAKAAWGTTPAPVQAEINRAFAEYEKGITEYRARFEPLRQFDDMARQSGTTLAAAMENYVGLENALRQNPIQGLERVCQNMGLSLRDVAAHVMGQPAEPKDAQVIGLTQQVQQMQGELARYQAAERQQAEERQTKALETVSAFATQHPRYAELEHHIAWALNTGAVRRTGDPAADLKSAYDFADRLIPGPQPAPVAAPAATAAIPTPPPAQTRRAGISIDGAPGSNPTVRPKARNIDEAIDNAFGQVGL
jgi:TolA-binding protein